MFNVEKFVEAISDESLEVRLRGVESLKNAPKALQQLMRVFASIEREWHEKGALVVFFGRFDESLCISERRIPRDYSRKDANQGKKMRFHPVTGDPVKSLELYHWKEKYWRRADTTGGEWGSGRQAGWDIGIFYGEYFLKGKKKVRRICEDDLKKGDSYPKHWKYDPWTGEELS